MIIVTQSGSNVWHGSLYEFVRNSVLDAANYFDVGSAPPFQRNQFGASSGGAIRKEKMFLFGNYVPGLAARAAAALSVQPLLSLWPTAAAGTPEFNAEPDCVYSSDGDEPDGNFRDGRSNHEHVHNRAATSIRLKADLVKIES